MQTWVEVPVLLPLGGDIGQSILPLQASLYFYGEWGLQLQLQY